MLVLRWRCLVNATPWPLYPRERPHTRCTGGWVALRAGRKGCVILASTGFRTPEPSRLYPITTPSTLSRRLVYSTSQSLTFYILVLWMIYGTWINPNNTNSMERKIIVPVKCLKRGNKRVYISNIKNSVLWNYAKIFPHNINKTEIPFVKSFIYITYLYICMFMRSCMQKVSNKISVNPYRLNIS
jgi:hypothetical protein